MRFLVSVSHDGVKSTLGPFNLESARATVTRLACEPMSRERFSAYLIPVPDEEDLSELPDTPLAA
jgi:hypothetical protein